MNHHATLSHHTDMPKLIERRRLKGRRKRPRLKIRIWARNVLIKRDRGLCRYCGRQVTLADGPRQATIDHVVPRSRGGSDKLDNLALACARCNNEKADGVAIDIVTT